MNRIYTIPIALNALYVLVAVTELVADASVDWLDAYWLAGIIGIGLLAISFSAGFLDEDRKPRIISASLTILSMILWCGIFYLFEMA